MVESTTAGESSEAIVRDYHLQRGIEAAVVYAAELARETAYNETRGAKR
jgi:uncharacterized protein (DUF433 family)